MSREQAVIATQQSAEPGPAVSVAPPAIEQSAAVALPNAEGASSATSSVSASIGAEQTQTMPPTAADMLNSAAPEPASASDMFSAGMPPQWLEQAQNLLQVGGPVVWILSGMSLIALTIILVKLWQFMLLRAESQADVQQALRLWRVGEHAVALGSLKTRRPVSELVGMAMQGLASKSTDLALLKEELARVASLRLAQMRAFLRPLEVIATLSPLLGLLGTVLGMILAFQQMEAAGNQVDPSVLSGGIWQALLTTAVGLAVAIPVVAAHTWLERKVERVAAAMDDAVTQVFTQFKPEAELESAFDELMSAEVMKRAA